MYSIESILSIVSTILILERPKSRLSVTKSISYGSADCWSTHNNGVTGYIKYQMKMGTSYLTIGEDFEITCNRNYNEIELTNQAGFLVKRFPSIRQLLA